jgi:predicted RNase H-like HicB family nuclease
VNTYTVRCEWDDTGWWVVTVPDIPGAITQTRRLDQVEKDVAEVIELMTGETPGAYAIELDWEAPIGGDLAKRAQRARADAERKAEEAVEATKAAARVLREAGFSYRDIGTMTGVSYQRAQQLLHDRKRAS